MIERSFSRSTAAKTIGNLGSNGNRLRDQSLAFPAESMTAIARKPSSFVSKIQSVESKGCFTDEAIIGAINRGMEFGISNSLLPLFHPFALDSVDLVSDTRSPRADT